MRLQRQAQDASSTVTYAGIAFIGLLLGIGLLFFYVYQVPGLIAGGVQNQIFYLLLMPWALSCAAFLFGGMRSYARFTHKHLGNALELGGPVVLFFLVLLGGFKLVPSPPETFDLTVRPYSQDRAVITSGRITLELGNARPEETIGSNGEANFKNIPPKFKDAAVRILPEVEGYKPEWQQHNLAGNVLLLPLTPLPPLLTHLKGSIIPPPADWQKLRVFIDGQNGEARVDELGNFDFRPVSEKDGGQVMLKIYADRKLVYYDYQTLPGPVNIRLHR
jgi:hypothetical protein